MKETMSFEETVRLRHSVRSFTDTPLTDAQLTEVLEDAAQAPSNCNTQPWQVHIVSGEIKDKISKAMIHEYENGRSSLDFSFDTASYTGVFGERRYQQGATYYQSIGVARDDKEGRVQGYLKNLRFFNAPHAAFLFMPSVGDNVRVAGDVGMYAQTFLLSLTARGYAGIPQTLLGFYADTIREYLDVPADFKLLFGISFGYEDVSNASTVKMNRAPTEQTAFFYK